MKKNLFRTTLLRLTLLGLMAAGVGCSYYQITDPATGDVYYTTKQKVFKHSGSTSFKDAVSGDQVTLTGHKVRKLKSEEYKEAVAANQGEEPAQ